MFLSSRQAGYCNSQQRPKDLHARGVPGGHVPPENFEHIALKWLQLVHFWVN